jgi:hypothetical protein
LSPPPNQPQPASVNAALAARIREEKRRASNMAASLAESSEKLVAAEA